MKMVPLGDFIKVAGHRAGKTTAPVYSVTKHSGFVPSLEYFKKQVFSKDTASYKLVEAGDFAYATIHLDEGSIGIAPERALISPMYTVFRPDSSKVDSAYLIRFLKSPQALAHYQTLGAGAIHRRKAISLTALSSLLIPLPPLDEQRRIASILNQADDLRAKRRAQLAHLDALPQAIFHEMFGDPVINPQDLPLVPLSQLGQLDRGVSRHRPRNDPRLLGGDYPLIQTGDVARSGGRIKTYVSTYSEFGLAQSKLWPSGTLCITIAANIAETGILEFNACFPDSVVGFSAPIETVTFIQVWLSFLQRTLEAQAPHSAQRNINLATLRSLMVPLPTGQQRTKFFERILVSQSWRPRLEASVLKLDSLFASLQSRAFRGEL